jgi:hypothetical protein
MERRRSARVAANETLLAQTAVVRRVLNFIFEF